MKNLIFSISFLLLVTACQAKTITVDDDAPADFETIQAAINASRDGDAIIVSPGTYTGPGNRDIDFKGKTITVRSTDPNDPDIIAATIIDCNGTEDEQHSGFFFARNESRNSVLAGLTITNGFAKRGGAIYCFSSSPTITDCMLVKNGGYAGGGICCEAANPILINCTFSNNWVSRYGGGMYNIRGNSPTLNSCTFLGNRAGHGGGIASDDSSPTLVNCKFVGNMAERGGGGVSNQGGILSLANCTFSTNSAKRDGGGGMATYGSEAKLTNCTFSGNWGQGGSAVVCDSYQQKHPSNLQITNCILWEDGDEIWNNDSSAIAITYSNVQGGWLGEGNIDVDPCFPFERAYHLMSNSPCIDAGTNTPVAGLPTTDIDGNPRTLDGDGDETAVTDIGAYEYNRTRPAIAVSPVRFFYRGGYPPAVQSLRIRNCAEAALSWEIVEDSSWLQAIPRSGTCSGDISEVSLVVQSYGLAPRYYNCALTVSDQDGVNRPVTVWVSLLVPSTLHVPSEYETIQAGIDAAEDFQVVVVAPGTYTGDGNRDLDFKGKPVTVRSIDPTDRKIVAATIIDCNGTEEDPHCGFYFHSEEDANSIVDGLTITNGYERWRIVCDPPLSYLCWEEVDPGCGIYCEGKSWYGPRPGPTIRNCIIRGNTASCGICGCTGPITNCIISNNNNLGTRVYCSDSGHICYHTVNEYSGLAGCDGPITNCIITANQGGGLIYCSGPIINCIIGSNKGGGLEYCTGPITNCVITANQGGGLINCRGPVTNCTICNNTGTGFSFSLIGSNEAALINSIVWGNAVLWGQQISVGPTPSPYFVHDTLSVSYSDVQGGQASVHLGSGSTLDWRQGNIDSDPLLTWDGHLQIGSPCINAGAPNADYAGQTDIDGESRVAGGRADIGADEYIDIDMDGLPDWWEQSYFNDPNAADPNADPDEDGYTNLEEYQISSDPTAVRKTYYVTE